MVVVKNMRCLIDQNTEILQNLIDAYPGFIVKDSDIRNAHYIPYQIESNKWGIAVLFQPNYCEECPDIEVNIIITNKMVTGVDSVDAVKTFAIDTPIGELLAYVKSVINNNTNL